MMMGRLRDIFAVATRYLQVGVDADWRHLGCWVVT
jgi:hypothetical protein